MHYDDTQNDFICRSVWSNSKRLVYCEKQTRQVVEYQWKDLEAGVFDKVTRLEWSGQAARKTAGVAIEQKGLSILTRDGRLLVKGIEVSIAGSDEVTRR